MTSGCLRFILFILFVKLSQAQFEIVGPGAVIPFTVANMGDFMFQRGPAAGYFIAGSSVLTMNGLYVKISTENIPDALQSISKEVYMHDDGTWLLALVSEHGNEEWLLIDSDWNDRFGGSGSTPPRDGNGAMSHLFILLLTYP